MLVLVVFLISTWSLVYYINRALFADMQRLVGEQQFATVSLVAGQVNDELRDRIVALEATAARVTSEMLDSPAAMQTRLEESTVLHGLFNGGIFVTRTDGIAIADIPVSTGRIGVNYLDRESIAGPLRDGKSVVGHPAMGKKLGVLIFSIVAPIRSRGGTVIGVIAGTINLGQPNFLEEIAANHYGKTGGYFISDPAKRLILSATDKSRAMQPFPPVGVNVMLDRYVQGYEGYGLSSLLSGVEVISSAKRIPAANWILAASIPTAEAFAPIRELQQRLLLAAMLVTAAGGALTWWISRRQYLGARLGLENEELRRTRSELEAERNRYSDLYANAPVGYCGTNEQGRIERANHAVEATLGAAPDALVNRSLSDFVAEVDKPAYERLHREAVMLDAPQSEDLRMLRADGTTFWAGLTATRHLDDDGLQVRFVLADITEKVEQERRRTQHETAHRKALVREVHHRINNSLHGVIGLLGRFADHHPETATPMKQAIGQVGAISLVHGLRGHEDSGTVILHELIESIVREIRELWLTSIALEIPAACRSRAVNDDDAVSVAMILNELIVNAVKHGGLVDGGVSVKVNEGTQPGVIQILISNPGRFREDAHGVRTRHGGLHLIDALMPRHGAHIAREQWGDRVVTTFELQSPVVSIRAPATTALT